MEKKVEFNSIKNVIKNRGLIIYPTDTVYGIGGSIESEESIKRIYLAKERDFSSPLIALISDRNKINDLAYINPKNEEKIKKLIEKFWPGGLTIILKKKEWVPGIMTANGNTIGIRMPNLKIALEIIEAAGGILPTTSANISKEPTPRSYEELSQKIKERADIVIDGGASPVGRESTIIDMSDTPKILRVGAISIKEIENIIGKL